MSKKQRYKFKGRDEHGKIQTGIIEAVSVQMVVSELKSMGIKVITINGKKKYQEDKVDRENPKIISKKNSMDNEPEVLFAKKILYMGVKAYLLGGFVAGVFYPKGLIGLEENIFDRLASGFIMGILSIWCGGFPITNFLDGDPINAWPYIFGCWVFLILIESVSNLYKKRSREKNISNQ